MAGVRIGEAAHPGPSNDFDDPSAPMNFSEYDFEVVDPSMIDAGAWNEPPPEHMEAVDIPTRPTGSPRVRTLTAEKNNGGINACIKSTQQVTNN